MRDEAERNTQPLNLLRCARLIVSATFRHSIISENRPPGRAADSRKASTGGTRRRLHLATARGNTTAVPYPRFISGRGHVSGTLLHDLPLSINYD